MEKVHCKDCDVLILPATAKSTGGICMACKNGIRRRIEESRAYHKKLREYDPLRELWISLVQRNGTDPKLSRWTDVEKRYFAVALLKGEVYNGGFDQYFTNSSSDHYFDALAGLQELEAVNSIELTNAAAKILLDGVEPPRNQDQRLKLIISYPLLNDPCDQEWSIALDKLDRRFNDDPDGLDDLLGHYAESNNLIQPFQR